MDLPLERGLLVEQVERGSSADRAGIQGGRRRVFYGNIPLIIGGDVIISLAGEPVTSTDDIRNILEARRPGQEVTIVFFRNQDRVEKTIELVGRESNRTFRF
jgi:S1-C subfamily serine protease